MKKIFLVGMVVLALCFAGCGDDNSDSGGSGILPAKPNGNAGVSVNAAGDLVINAPLYYIDYDEEGIIDGSYPVKTVDLSLNETVHAFINFTPTGVTGTISGGMFSITIPAPSASLLIPIIDNPDLPITFIKSGAGTKTGFLWLYTTSMGIIQLFANPPSLDKLYTFTYADGSATISGANTEMISDLSVAKGWNSILISENTIIEQVSANPTTNAKWIFFDH